MNRVNINSLIKLQLSNIFYYAIKEYAKKLSKFKSRVKSSNRNKDESSSASEAKSETTLTATSEDVVDDISQAKTPKAKSSLLQKKLAEDRKIFEQRSREMIENNKIVGEKVEALRQQLDETYQPPVIPLNPVLVTSQVIEFNFTKFTLIDNQ